MQPTAAQWLEDLDFLAARLDDVHPNAFKKISKADFQTQVEELKTALPSLDYNQTVIRIMQLAALIGDGHTLVQPVKGSDFDQWFPIRFYEYSDGLFINAIDPESRQLLRTKVLEIGQVSAEEALARASSLMGADNEFWDKESRVLYLSNAAALHALGITTDQDLLPLTTRRVKLSEHDHPEEKLEDTLVAYQADFNMDWRFMGEMFGPPDSNDNLEAIIKEKKPADFLNMDRRLPPYLRWREAYWFEFWPQYDLLFMQFNRCGNMNDETFEEFVARMWNLIDENNIGKLVLDIRYNSGGDSSLIKPLVHGIIQRPKLNQRGNVFALIGRKTFSAAMMLAAALRRDTQTTFVGEPGGCSFNFFGGLTSFNLPYSGLQVYMSTQYIQWGRSTDAYPYEQIDIPVTASAVDYFGGHDPVLQNVLGLDYHTIPQIFWEKGALSGQNAYHGRKVEHGVFPWWRPFEFNEAMEIGAKLMKADRLEDALGLFRLATEVYQSPKAWEKLGNVYLAMKQRAHAREAFENALGINPYFPGASHARKMVAELADAEYTTD